MNPNSAWYQSGKHHRWAELMANPLFQEVVAVILEKARRVTPADDAIEIHAMHNARRDGVYSVINFMEDLTRVPSEPQNQVPQKQWTRHQKAAQADPKS